MQRRTSLKLLVAMAAFVCSPLLFAQEVLPIKPAQPGGEGGKVEVIEFFSYGCAHCRRFEPMINKWAANQPPHVVFRKVPISFGDPTILPLVKMHYTLQAMGLLEKLVAPMFEAVQDNRVSLDKEVVRNEWLAKQGVDVKKFNDTWRSFSVDAQAKRADQMSAAFKVTGVPAVAVNGKFLMAGAGETTLTTADKLIAQERGASVPGAASVTGSAKSTAPKNTVKK